MEPWWKRTVIYQIYPKSFNDTTGNGVGDLPGIIEKLDYLNDLGIDVLWLNPVYPSPQKDNGYDISDYYNIYDVYGTMEDFERLLAEAHARNMKIIMDIVINHTSTDHAWFQAASSDASSPYRDYYIWKDPVDGAEPNNWVSKFGGSAWQWHEPTSEYYLHLFDVSQADLNWENEELRQQLYDMMNYWFEKGIDGFRLDVINLISKDQRFPNDDIGDGRRFYTDGPRVHEWMHEMHQNVFARHGAMTVGEMSSTTIDHCIKYTRPDREELSMTFNFHHLKADYPGGEKWALPEFDFVQLKETLSDWQIGMYEGGGWNALFWCNHDQPRIVSRYADDGKYRVESAKMLAATMHCMRGTPYIYQGEELGMTNPSYSSIEDYRDVETINYYDIMQKQGKSPEEAFAVIQARSRDNARTPMQWDSSKNAGFSEAEPWLPVPENYTSINAKEAVNDPDSVYHFYKKLIQLRKDYKIMTAGDYQLYLPDHSSLFAYTREDEDEALLLVSNFSSETIEAGGLDLPWKEQPGTIFLTNYQREHFSFGTDSLQPYESIVLHYQK
ncbi:alpha,alpha-phosphotrehalase [Marinococcus halophilus]|uniref:Alpha,alpha-phosphotrehalase n=1 Tax=Marinococcus halophilus TaxID=1371 RepID=A0A510Y9B4_MARHA|nr:alpha,alpha-phosphotrehalase [Marinococcus halophilus]OZT79039.1 alpha,alpha-phosphotrehalase [Marinococcus halophilus]GEK59972.1 trehalose-6-phosphate hydrolase [Marinococcus halophilus]